MANPNDTFRGFILGAPGVGKTHFLGDLLRRFPRPGIIVDPCDEITEVPERFEKIVEDEDFNGFLDKALDGKSGGLLAIDECHLFMRASDDTKMNRLLKALDRARNINLHFCLASKRPTLLPPHITELCNWVLINPARTPATRRWTKAAGVDFLEDGQVLPRGEWATLSPAGIGQSSTEAAMNDIADSFGWNL